MALVHVTNVSPLKNPTPFNDTFAFEIAFQAVVDLEDDLEWKLIYVGSAENEAYDQELDSILVGPIPKGANKFTFEAAPPRPETIPEYDLLGVTVILITCSYRQQEFIRVGFYVNNEYMDPELQMPQQLEGQTTGGDDDMESEDGLASPQIPQPGRPINIDKLYRNILASKPRVTRFNIEWGV